MPFYTYSQNNSGGRFFRDDDRGISKFVIVEATSASHADSIAENLGIYFDGVREDRDCPCCGDRWYSQIGDKGTDEPEIYGIKAAGYNDYMPLKGVNCYIHFLDGSLKGVAKSKEGWLD